MKRLPIAVLVFILLCSSIFSSKPVFADYLNLIVSPAGSASMNVSFNAHPGEYFIKWKKNGGKWNKKVSIKVAGANISNSGRVFQSRYMGCGTYKVKVKRKGRGWRSATVTPC